MLNPGFVTRKALAQWQDIPVFLPQFQFHEKHQTVIKTHSPEKILSLIATFDSAGRRHPAIDVGKTTTAKIPAQ